MQEVNLEGNKDQETIAARDRLSSRIDILVRQEKNFWQRIGMQGVTIDLISDNPSAKKEIPAVLSEFVNNIYSGIRVTIQQIHISHNRQLNNSNGLTQLGPYSTSIEIRVKPETPSELEKQRQNNSPKSLSPIATPKKGEAIDPIIVIDPDDSPMTYILNTQSLRAWVLNKKPLTRAKQPLHPKVIDAIASIIPRPSPHLEKHSQSLKRVVNVV